MSFKNKKYLKIKNDSPKRDFQVYQPTTFIIVYFYRATLVCVLILNLTFYNALVFIKYLIANSRVLFYVDIIYSILQKPLT